MPSPPDELEYRPASPTDAARIHAFHDTCSPASRQRRWLTGMHEIPARYLTSALHGGPEHLCLLATNGGDVVALASAVLDPTSRRWDLGVLVTDCWQRRGVGRALVDKLVSGVRARGGTGLIALLDHQNAHLLTTLGRHGTVRAEVDTDGIAVTVDLSELSPPAPGPRY